MFDIVGDDVGIRFTNFHVSPVCSVTRSMLLTGNNNIEVGLGAFDYSVYPPTRGKKGYETYLTADAVTISELLKDDGYEVYKSGKWHLGGERPGSKGPLGWGFTKEFGIYSGGSNHWNNLAMTPDFQDPNGLNEKRVEEWTLNGEPYERPEGIYSGEIYTNLMQGELKAMKVRTGMFGDGEWHLYNVVDDPSETQPLEKGNPEKLKEMVALYESYTAKNNIIEVDKDWNPFQGASE